jgi:hypothetical protein
MRDRELAMVPLTAAITFGVGRLLDRRPFSLLYGALAMAVPAVLSRRQARRSP